MSIEVVCACQRTLRVPAEHAGKKVICPGCGAVQVVPVPVVVEEVVEAVQVDPPKKKKKRKKSAYERELALAKRDYEGERLVGGETESTGGLTLFGIHLTAGVIGGFSMLVLGILAIIMIKLAPEHGRLASPRTFYVAIVFTGMGALLLVKSLFFGSEE
jgi:hypothetical protein